MGAENFTIFLCLTANTKLEYLGVGFTRTSEQRSEFTTTGVAWKNDRFLVILKTFRHDINESIADETSVDLGV